MFPKGSILAAIVGLDMASLAEQIVPPSTTPTTGPSGHEIEIRDFKYSGSGCPPGTASGLISSDLTTMTLSYSKYAAQSGPGIDPVHNRKNCNVMFNLDVPQGWQYSIVRSQFRGYANIAAGGSKGTCKSTWWFAGDGAQGSSELNINGPFDDDYSLLQTGDVTSLVWSECGASSLLNVNSQVRVVPLGTSVPNLLTVDNQDLSFKQVYYFQWKECNR